MKSKLLIIPNTLAYFGGGEHLAFEMFHKLSSEFEIKLINAVSKKDFTRSDKSKLLKEHAIDESAVIDVPCASMKMVAYKTEDFLLMIPTAKGISILRDAVKQTDIIYCITNNPLLLTYAVFFANRYKKKFVFGIQNRIFANYFEKAPGLKEKVGTFMFRRVLKRAKNFHSLNSYDQSLVRKHIPKAHAYLIPGFAQFEDREIRQNNKEFIVLFAGRLPKFQKGIDLLCDAIAKVLSRNRRIKFVIAGGGGDGEPLVKDLARRYKKNVKWLGFVPYEKVKEQYKNAALVLITSRGDELRYFPLVFLEAQSFGLPIVTFNGNGYSDILEDGVGGALIKPFDTRKFANAILRYFEIWKGSKKKYLAIKKAIAKTTTEKFSEEKIMPKMAEMLKSAKN